MMFDSQIKGLMIGVGLLALTACESLSSAYPNRVESDETSPTWSNEAAKPGLFGPGGLSLFGDPKKKKEDGGSGIGVNAFLWRASIDTVSFMPLSSADPFGGVILTDWFSPPESPQERFKLSVFILDRQLRADSLRVSVFRQTRTPAGGWVDAAVEQRTAIDLENTILTRAREMRTSSTTAR